MIGQTFSHFRVVELLGEGGMGVVYRADDLRLGRQVAIKFLPEPAATDRHAFERLQREARAASALNHQNICTIHEVDEFEGRPFIVMELLEGHTLKEYVRRKHPDLDTIVRLATQIADALGAAHAKGIIQKRRVQRVKVCHWPARHALWRLSNSEAAARPRAVDRVRRAEVADEAVGARQPATDGIRDQREPERRGGVA
jgi:hypothetical protein